MWSKAAAVIVLTMLAAACGTGGSRPVATPSTPAASSGDANPVSIAVVGDWGAGTAAQRLIASAMCAQRMRTPFRIVISTGDNFYPAGNARPDTFDKPEHCLNAYPGNRWRAVWGNHDASGTSTATVLAAPKYDAWSVAGVEFFMLDANDVGDAKQRSWLQRRLAASSARMKVAVFHQPPFTVGGVHPDDLAVQESWVPLFERYHVRLVLNGHQHDYEHSIVRGVHYVVTGGGGSALYPCVRKPATLVACASAHHFLLLTIGPAGIEVRAITQSGATLDRFAIAP